MNIINNYSQIEAIIKCQIEMNYLKKILLNEKQKENLKKMFVELRLDNYEYSNFVLDRIEGISINE